METRKQTGSSTSFTSELFGSKESDPSSYEILGSIFSRESPKVSGTRRGSPNSEFSSNGQDCATVAWKFENPERQVSLSQDWCFADSISKKNESQSQNRPTKDSYVYQEQKVQPCHLSSSIYYGGQDIYSHPPNAQMSALDSMNDEGEDDSGSASRGNWWQGSLYY